MKDWAVVSGFFGVVVYVVLCAIIGAKADKTNRTGAGYFFLSLFFSPLVGFITLSLSMLANIELAHGAQEKKSSSTPFKTDISAQILAEEKRKKAEGRASDTGSRMQRADITWECPECQNVNPNSSFACENCGHSLK